MFKVLLILLFVTQNALAVNLGGDFFTSGNISSPAAGTLLVDTGGITQFGGSHDYYNFKLVASCTVACILEAGVYDSGNVAVSTYSLLVLSGSTIQNIWELIPMTNGQKFRIKVSTLNLGTVNVALWAQYAGND